MSTPSEAVGVRAARRRSDRSARSAGSIRSGPGARGSRWPAAEPADVEAFAGPPADPESVARTILLDQLTGRARSRAELREALARRDVPEEVAEAVLDRFTEVGLIDDAAFARSWVESRQAGKGLARRALGEELRRKGVAGDVVSEALADVDPADEEVAARRLVRQRLPAMTRLDATTRTRRLIALLGRKGYPAGLAYAVVRAEVAGDLECAPPDE